MQLQTKQHYYTPEEYLQMEEKVEDKNEYHNGEIIPMTGSTTNHNKIAVNFCRKFPLTINDQDYELYIGDIKLLIPNYKVYTYPDIMIVKGKPIYEGSGKTIINNPLIIAEILSKSTQNYDRGEKFKYYRSLPSLSEYILIDQYSFYVEQYAKQNDQRWLFKDNEGSQAMLNLDSIDFQIAFSDLYARIDFDYTNQ
jgi:Uma2 family endonuclease